MRSRWCSAVGWLVAAALECCAGPVAAHDPAQPAAPCEAAPTRPPAPTPNDDEEVSDFPLGPTIALAISGGALLLGAIVGVEAMRRADELKEQCPHDVCPERLAEEGETAQKWADASTALFGAGGIGLVMGTTWLIIDLTAGSEADDEPGRVSARLGPGAAELQLRW